ncbi:hypothetical protein FAM21834_00613 [Lentilactobacillus parabuchneri]|mgnify:FL=1|jgi:hypothetical protein|uniref:Uncharacterized protein n=2 Tax=Lentilactobacillus parabuchneri TaxID=152331 RepID=A0A1X1FGJ4_9LACO|nr:hypothetical protein [Lentilactobacillus parabuchneri]APR06887.1 hypothetical protein FAM21731_00675 [Lentilactobacillus parabuchneri]KRM45773.1 hypothetical protein FC51_GL000683 [Lentilactobacillus parabuchneri DSM 5707 = NBRC 107865]KRN72304.1 hypothetical protein IV42_GL001439 [Lentilactobacillus parabuchneri]MBW0223382.1 hypothetical protein [Lentilactobacillus parabuchneri]MBW0246423.1 hypothetical protein [Lentilactobacillus parabuchneri]
MEKFGHTVPSKRQATKHQTLVAVSVAHAKQKPTVRMTDLKTTFEVDGIVDVGTFPRMKRIEK